MNSCVEQEGVIMFISPPQLAHIEPSTVCTVWVSEFLIATLCFCYVEGGHIGEREVRPWDSTEFK